MTSPSSGAADFPRLHARTQRFTLGRPRTVTVSPDGARVVYLRSRGGEDPSTCLWVLDAETGHERLVADPAALRGADEGLPEAELARRERVRETAGGIVSYATDRAVTRAALSLGGHLYLADLVEGTTRRHPTADVALDPRPSPDGALVAYVRDGALRVAGPDDARGTTLVEEADPERTPAGTPTVTWGLADFVAAEEMGRTRGFWWSPDAEHLAVTRVDTTHVTRWYLDELAAPEEAPRTIAYPAAGTANADVSLHVVALDGTRREVVWDREFFPYLADVQWDEDAPLTLVVQSRDQRTLRVLTVDVDDDRGAGLVGNVAFEEHAQHWVELVPGAPRWLPDGRLLHVVDTSPGGSATGGGAGDTRALAVDGAAFTPEGLQVRRVVDADADAVTVVASADDPTAIGVWRIGLDGREVRALTADDGVHDARVGGQTLVLSRASLAQAGMTTTVHTPSGDVELPSAAAVPPLQPRVQLLTLGERGLRGALVLPTWWEEGDAPLPVLLDPYGGPHAQRVLQASDAFLTSQWFAEQGFAVLVVDGRGTPGRGPTWEHAVAGDLASAPLEDQIDGLRAAAEHSRALDLERVGIRGWSFGGYLAALAVLRRPDAVHAAVAGAPVTQWRLYDTHYTERYLGHPEHDGEAYEHSSLLADAHRLSRPLLLIHGLADDNVVAAHTLQLSRALVEAGRLHTVLPLSGVTHMTPQEQVAANLLTLQLAFLREALDLPARD